MDCLHQVAAFIILDSEGRRVFTKYYCDVVTGGAGKWPTVDAQFAFEQTLHTKTRTAGASNNSSEGDVLLYQGSTIVYVLDAELGYYVVGPADENELVLSSVLTCVYESMQTLLKTVQPLEKRPLLEAYESLLLVIDETIDDGIILETSASAVVAEVQPFAVSESQVADGAKKTFASLNRFLKQNV